MIRNHVSAKHAALVGAVAASMVLAGCVDFFSAHGATHGFASFEEAFGAASTVYGPQEGDSPLRLKLLAPHADDFPVGEDVVFSILLYDSTGPTPVRDASIALTTHMPAHDGMEAHGTGHEKDPKHESYGIYVGETNLVMAGVWELQFGVVADDTVLEFIVPVTAVGDDGMDHDEHMGDDNDTMEHDEHMGDDDAMGDDPMGDDDTMGDDDQTGDDEGMGDNETGDNETGDETGNETGNNSGPADAQSGTWSLNLPTGNGQAALFTNFTVNGTASVINSTLALKPHRIQNNEDVEAPVSIIQAFEFWLEAPDGTKLDNATTGPGVYVHPAATGQGIELNLTVEATDLGPGVYWLKVRWVGALIAFDATWTVTP